MWWHIKQFTCKVGFTRECVDNADCLSNYCINRPYGIDGYSYNRLCWPRKGSLPAGNADDADMTQVNNTMLISMHFTAPTVEDIAHCVDLSDHNPADGQEHDEEEDTIEYTTDGCQLWSALGTDTHPVANVTLSGSRGEYLHFAPIRNHLTHKLYVVQSAVRGAPICDEDEIMNVFVPKYLAQRTLYGKKAGNCTDVITTSSKVEHTEKVTYGFCSLCDLGAKASCYSKFNCLSRTCQDRPAEYQTTPPSQMCWPSDRAEENAAHTTHMAFILAVVVVGFACMLF